MPVMRSSIGGVAARKRPRALETTMSVLQDAKPSSLPCEPHTRPLPSRFRGPFVCATSLARQGAGTKKVPLGHSTGSSCGHCTYIYIYICVYALEDSAHCVNLRISLKLNTGSTKPQNKRHSLTSIGYQRAHAKCSTQMYSGDLINLIAQLLQLQSCQGVVKLPSLWNTLALKVHLKSQAAQHGTAWHKVMRTWRMPSSFSKVMKPHLGYETSQDIDITGSYKVEVEKACLNS